MLFVGIDLYRLFFIDQAYPVYLYNVLHNAVKGEKNRIDAGHFKEFFETAFLKHPISNVNTIQKEEMKNTDLKFMQAVYTCIRNFRIDTKQIQSNIVIERLDLTQAVDKIKEA
mgnify:CR=1 FL=1